jgi:hypothetical protein
MAACPRMLKLFSCLARPLALGSWHYNEVLPGMNLVMTSTTSIGYICTGRERALANVTDRRLWILVADDQTMQRQLALVTNVLLNSVKTVQEVYNVIDGCAHASNISIASK